MNINRHNYESWFILYMDNELDPAQRAAVEAFVQSHPDLREELELLQQFKLTPDTSIVFEGKESLMMPPVQTVNNGQLQEWMLLALDNELEEEKKTQLESLIASDNAVKKEWELMQSTRLQPEQIVFQHKESLYRREEKVRRLPAWSWRVAAAVILFLLTGTAVVVIFNNRKSANPDKEIVNTNPGNKHVEPSNEKVNGPSIENTTTDRQLAVDRVQETDVKQSDASTAVANEKAMKQNAVKNNLPELTDSPERKEESIARNEIPQSNNLPTPVVSDESTQRVTGDIAIKENSIKEIQSPNRAVTNPSVQPSDIRTAKADNFEDDGSTEEGSGKKGALRGFFRKVTRNVEKRTGVDPTNGDNRLLVGGLSIKLK